MVAHNAGFDMSFIEKTVRIWGSCGNSRQWIRLAWHAFCCPTEPVQAGHGGEGTACAASEPSPRSGRRSLYGRDFFLKFLDMLEEKEIRDLKHTERERAALAEYIKETADIPCDRAGEK